LGDLPQATHKHVACDTCGFEWVSPPHDAEKFREAL
jgi:hypothetical protein